MARLLVGWVLAKVRVTERRRAKLLVMARAIELVLE
jgi:hypothetical protein